MRTVDVIESDLFFNDTLCRKAVSQFFKIIRLLFERTPEPFNKDIVHAPATTIHGDGNVVVLEQFDKVDRREPTSLVGAHDVRFAVAGDSLFNRLNAKRRFQR